MSHVISVFGSSAPQPGSADYELARDLGRRLAEAGFTVQTGGYMGVMEGLSRGDLEDGQEEDKVSYLTPPSRAADAEEA